MESMLETRRIIALSLMLLILVGFTASSAVAASGDSTEVLAHKIIQTPYNIEIQDTDPILYYPGALMGFANTPINNTEILFNKDVAGFEVTFARLDYENDYEFVLLAVHGNDEFLIGVSTILIPSSNNSYSCAETDIGFFNRTTIEAMNTQEQVYQGFTQSWSQHYGNLIKAVHRVIQEYSSSGNNYLKGVAKIYAKFVTLLTILRVVVRTSLRSYDKIIDDPRAIVFNQVNPDDPGECDREYLSAVSGYQGASAVINGDAVAWCDQTPLFPPYLVWFDGTMSVVSWGQTGVTMPHTITLLDYWLTWGVGTATISSGGAGDTYVTFLMSGLAAWYLYVDTRFYQHEPYVTVTIMASTVGVDYDSADLILCC